MGRLQAYEMRRFGGCNEDTLRWHLQHNHYPPVHLDFLPPVKEAIERANADDWESEITLPNGRILTVHQIVTGLHLDAFLGEDPDDTELNLDDVTDESDEPPQGDPIIG